jgi:activating signal cointegrator 1
MIRVLSLWQPWATLVAIGAKRFETRSWAPTYRGRIAIHASKKWNRELLDLVNTDPFRATLIEAKAARFKAAPPRTWIYSVDHKYQDGLPFGAIVATADLVEAYPTADVRYYHEIEAHQTPLDPHFGDYSRDRFAWKLDNLIALRTPVPCVGHQGLFFPKPDELDALNAALKEAA